MAKNLNSFHENAAKACKNLMNASQHIGYFIEKQTSEQVENNRLRLQVAIDVIRWLAFQACAFRGRDESKEFPNRGNFLQLIKLLACYNEKVWMISFYLLCLYAFSYNFLLIKINI